MKNKYIDLIEQSFEFPNEEFNVEDNQLQSIRNSISLFNFCFLFFF